MKYLLFISSHNRLLHNAVYDTIEAVAESIAQLAKEEDTTFSDGRPLSTQELKDHLMSEDDFVGHLANGTRYHVQSHPVFGV
jgi:hypothetical protein